MEQLHRDGAPISDQTAPKGPIEERWDTRRFNTRLVNPTNRRRLSVIIIIGTGLAGARPQRRWAKGATIKDCYEDSPRRAHSIAAQGGINAAKNYRNDGDSIYGCSTTIKGGDYARASSVYRSLSQRRHTNAWHRACPPHPEYGSVLDNRSFGGWVSRTFYARQSDRPTAAARRLSPSKRQIRSGTVEMYARPAAGAHRRRRPRPAVVHLTPVRSDPPREGQIDLLGRLRQRICHERAPGTTSPPPGAPTGVARGRESVLHAIRIPVTGEHQSKLTLMSESCVTTDGSAAIGDQREPRNIPEAGYYLERAYPRSATWCRATWPRAAKRVATRPRVRPRGSRRLPRLHRRDQPARTHHDRRALRQPDVDMYAQITRPVPDTDGISGHSHRFACWGGPQLRPGANSGPVRDRERSPTMAPTGSAPALMGASPTAFILPNTIRDCLPTLPSPRSMSPTPR